MYQPLYQVKRGVRRHNSIRACLWKPVPCWPCASPGHRAVEGYVVELTGKQETKFKHNEVEKIENSRATYQRNT